MSAIAAPAIESRERWHLPTWSHVKEKTATKLYQTASTLTDPICYAHALMRSYQVLDHKNPQEASIRNRCRIIASMVAYLALGIFTAPMGIVVRLITNAIFKQPFIHLVTEDPAKSLADREFTLLSWNICCVGGGYTITDGGVTPWYERIDRIAQTIIGNDPDVACIYETLDTGSAFKLYELMKNEGYKHFFFNMGSKAVGASSGLFVASKFEVAEPCFTGFPKEYLYGRAQHTSKGFFSVDLISNNERFATLISTHLQHSELPQFGIYEEVEARRNEMNMITAEVEKVERLAIVTGDLNLDDCEYESSSWSQKFIKKDLFTAKTWGGDKFCADFCKKDDSAALNLDHTMMVKNDWAGSIETEYVDPLFNAEEYRAEALSDHAGLFSTIRLPA